MVLHAGNREEGLIDRCDLVLLAKGYVAENNTTFRLKDVEELVYGGFGRITKEVWSKAEDHVLKIEKENFIDRSEIPPIITDFDDDESSDDES